jgi:hypothetical protein
MKRRVLTILFFSLYVLSGCTLNKIETLPDCGIPIEHMNNEVLIYPIPGRNTYKIGDLLDTEIKITKDVIFKAPIDLNIQLFQLCDNSWIEISNLSIYFGEDYVLDSKTPKAVFAFQPNANNVNNKAEVFVCISGEIVNDKVLKVGASRTFMLSGGN